MYIQVKISLSLLFNHKTHDCLFKVGGFASSSATLRLSSFPKLVYKNIKIFSSLLDNF